jgi:2-methylcitrate dehydratase
MKEPIPQTFQMAKFALSSTYEEIRPEIRDQLKKHLLDATGSLIHSYQSPTIHKLARQISTLSSGGTWPVPIIGHTAVDRAAQWYTALIRYPDFMDNFLGKEATCHPSDNIGPLLAIAPIRNISGKDFLLSMAVGYEMECRLIEEIPVMVKGFDHCLLLAYSVTATTCRMLRLDETQTANALAIAGCTFNPLVSCRASYTREWKGFQSSMIVLGAVNIAYQAKEGMTGPVHLFEGPKGFTKEFGMELEYNWDDDHFDLIPKCVLKSYNSEVHTQSLIEGALKLKEKNKIDPKQIKKISAETFLTAYHIVGGGEYGERKTVKSKEQADHSLPYVLAVSLLDGELYPEQLLPERIKQQDVQELLQKVDCTTKFPLHEPVKVVGLIDPYTRAYPEKLMGALTITMNDGNKYSIEVSDYHGFHTRPLSWEDVSIKFKKLTASLINPELQTKIIELIRDFENHNAKELVELLMEASGSLKF